MSVPSPQSPLLLRLPSFPFLPRSPSLLPDPAFFYPQTHTIGRRSSFASAAGLQPSSPPSIRSSSRTSPGRRTAPAMRLGLTCRPFGPARATSPALPSLVPSADQALTAAAADGGNAADEHLSSGTSTMVVERVFPGGSDEHSTVSTRLFKEKAKKLSSSLTADILSSSPTVSNNILAMTFRQVVLQRLWSFQLSLFCPETERNMKDLANPRKDTADITVSSSDERFLSALAEAICSCTLKDTERNFLGSNNIFGWLQKPQNNCLVDSSICIYRISEGKIVRNARKHVDKFNPAKGKSLDRERKLKHHWSVPPSYSRLDKYGGPEFSAWTNEFIPAYMLQIDAHTFKDTKLEGWQKLADNRWEVLLTHFQLVVLSGDGKMIGSQPMRRVAVNHWASNPLAKVLYEGRKLSPGLLEPALRIPYRHEVVRRQ